MMLQNMITINFLEHTSEQMADFLMQLYDSDKVVGAVNRETFEFKMFDPLFDYAGNSSHNQKL